MTWLSNSEQEIIDLFWMLVGEKEPFPRSLERSISLALPLAIVKIPRLALGSIESWLTFRNIKYSFACESRFVRGSLVAYNGKGIIFCDGTDPTEEIRYTIAHELGHFLSDYWYPRKKAADKLGIDILDVFDGIRKPTVSERVHSLLEGTKSGIVTHLMDRQDISEITTTIEDKADKIAIGLIAPPNEVLRGLHLPQDRFVNRVEIITKKLDEVFGLPTSISKMYAHNLLQSIGKGPSWTETLRNR